LEIIFPTSEWTGENTGWLILEPNLTVTKVQHTKTTVKNNYKHNAK